MRRFGAWHGGHSAWARSLTLLVALTSCKPTAADLPAAERQLIVFGASSLREAFTAIGEDFRRAHPGVEVHFNFAGSHELRAQLEHGALADVFASADQRHMAALVAAARVTAPALFARNEPVLVVAREQSAELRTFSELPRAARILLGVPEVPIGRYSLQILDRASQTLGSDFRARVEARVVSRELNVRQILAKVSLGEADAGIVYRSDTKSSKARPAVVAIPAEFNVVAEYPLAILVDAPQPGLAAQWQSWVLSPTGRERLAAAGFQLPERATPAP